jgi:hypothetical protein
MVGGGAGGDAGGGGGGYVASGTFQKTIGSTINNINVGAGGPNGGFGESSTLEEYTAGGGFPNSQQKNQSFNDPEKEFCRFYRAYGTDVPYCDFGITDKSLYFHKPTSVYATSVNGDISYLFDTYQQCINYAANLILSPLTMDGTCCDGGLAVSIGDFTRVIGYVNSTRDSNNNIIGIYTQAYSMQKCYTLDDELNLFRGYGGYGANGFCNPSEPSFISEGFVVYQLGGQGCDGINGYGGGGGGGVRWNARFEMGAIPYNGDIIPRFRTYVSGSEFYGWAMRGGSGRDGGGTGSIGNLPNNNARGQENTGGGGGAVADNPNVLANGGKGVIKLIIYNALDYFFQPKFEVEFSLGMNANSVPDFSTNSIIITINDANSGSIYLKPK